MPRVSLMNVCVQQVSDDETTRDRKTEHPTLTIATETGANLCKKMQRGKEPLFM